jgi:hypothetical protein
MNPEGWGWLTLGATAGVAFLEAMRRRFGFLAGAIELAFAAVAAVSFARLGFLALKSHVSALLAVAIPIAWLVFCLVLGLRVISSERRREDAEARATEADTQRTLAERARTKSEEQVTAAEQRTEEAVRLRQAAEEQVAESERRAQEAEAKSEDLAEPIPEFFPDDAKARGFTWEPADYWKPGDDADSRHYGQVIITPLVDIQPIRLRIDLSRRPQWCSFQIHQSEAGDLFLPDIRSLIADSLRSTDSPDEAISLAGRAIEINEQEFPMRPGRRLLIIALASEPFKFRSIRRRRAPADAD